MSKQQLTDYETNYNFRRLKRLNNLTIQDICDLMQSEYGGPSYSTIANWSNKPNTANFSCMPAYAYDYFLIRLEQNGYRTN